MGKNEVKIETGKYKFRYDINAVLSDLVYTRILEPCSKRSSYKAASEFLEKPSYNLEKKLDSKYTCEELLNTLKAI